MGAGGIPAGGFPGFSSPLPRHRRVFPGSMSPGPDARDYSIGDTALLLEPFAGA